MAARAPLSSIAGAAGAGVEAGSGAAVGTAVAATSGTGLSAGEGLASATARATFFGAWPLQPKRKTSAKASPSAFKAASSYHHSHVVVCGKSAFKSSLVHPLRAGPRIVHKH